MRLILNSFNPYEGKRQHPATVDYKCHIGKDPGWIVHITYATGKGAFIPLETLEKMAVKNINSRKIKTERF